MSASESGSKRNENKLKIALIIATPLAALLAMLILCYYFCKNRGSPEERIKEKKENDIKNEGQDDDMGLPVFQLATISHATDNFSLSNKLGQGGFGPVYKGCGVQWVLQTRKHLSWKGIELIALPLGVDTYILCRHHVRVGFHNAQPFQNTLTSLVDIFGSGFP
ncbi:hypothetical protein SLEP1_g58957 [Rubroshorea leprosula]|uniref:Uncharacterized protein n=1 Tax=Rubroshorea leprosula TaxID=152421 RepID=A0AAV5MQY0_9ROSI|nr:hypothetical protein SLEP1_g58957 [Rubroshorea leprosula]